MKTQYNKLVKKYGVRIVRAGIASAQACREKAQAPHPPTKVDATDMSRAMRRPKRVTIAGGAEGIIDAAKMVSEAVAAKHLRVFCRSRRPNRLPCRGIGVLELTGPRRSHLAFRPENWPLSERLEKFRTGRVSGNIARIAGDYSGSTSIRVEFGGGEPGAWTDTSAGDHYSGRCKYRKTDATHHVRVSPDWYQGVHKRGLAVVDGLPTLAAEPVDAGGWTAYKATWCRASGKRLVTERGFIVLSPDHGAAHAKTLAGAKALITRRANEARMNRHIEAVREKLESRRANGYAEIQVTLGDSYRAGNCEAGTLAWRDRHFPGRDAVTVAELIEVDSQRAFAINAALHAIRKAKP